MAPMDMRKRYSKGKRKKTEAEPSQWKKYYRHKNVKIQIIKIVICGKNSTENSYMWGATVLSRKPTKTYCY